MARRFQCWLLGAALAAGLGPVDSTDGSESALRLAATGVLEKQVDSRGAQYTLLDEQGQPLYHVAASERLDLDRFAGQQVEVVGNLRARGGLALGELQAEWIAPASRVVPAHFVEISEQQSILVDPAASPLPSLDDDPPPMEAIPPEGLSSEGLPEPPEDLRAPPRMAPPTTERRRLIFEGPRNWESGHELQYSPGIDPTPPRFEPYDQGRSHATPAARKYWIWGSGDYLYWWTKGASLPPLLTTSPPGTAAELAGAIGSPSTEALLGDRRYFSSARNGVRWSGGFWLGPQRWLGLQGDVLILSDESFDFAAASNGLEILARPFRVDPPFPPDPSPHLVAYPGAVAGSFTADGRSRFGSTGLQLRANLLDFSADDVNSQFLFVECIGDYRIDMVAGYRYLQLDERLRLTELTTTSIAPQQGEEVRDRFSTTNHFHGGEIGLLVLWEKDRWQLDGSVQLAIGGNRQKVEIDGSTETSSGGVPDPVVDEGLLAQSPNIGIHRRTRTDLIPEFAVTGGYLLTPRLRLQAGYRLLFWPRVVRVGDAIDLARETGDTTPPEFVFHDSSFWAQGLNVGLDYRW